MSLLRGLLERRGADPTKPWGDSTPPAPGSLVPSIAGVRITDDTAMQVITVLACVSILADSVSTLPMFEYVFDSDGIRRRVSETNGTPFLTNPMEGMTRQDWLSQLMVSLLLRGNAYGAVLATSGHLHLPSQIQPLPPDVVTVRPYQGGAQYVISGRVQPPNSIVHLRGMSMPGSPVGLNPIQAARGGIALARATEDYGSAFFGNSAEASGVLSVDGDLTDDQARKLVRSWVAAHQGVNKAHLPAVLSGGAKWTSIAINPDDAQFLQTRDFQRHEIAMMFRIPEHMIGVQDRTSSWGAGIEQMEIGYVINTLRPWLTRFESVLSALLPSGHEVRFDLSGRLRGDTGQRFTAYQTAINNGWMCVDEVRDLESLPPLPDGKGQVYYQSVQAVPVGTVAAEPVGAGVNPSDTP